MRQPQEALDELLSPAAGDGAPPQVHALRHFVATASNCVLPFVPVTLRPCAYLVDEGAVPCVLLTFLPNQEQEAFTQHLQVCEARGPECARRALLQCMARGPACARTALSNARLASPRAGQGKVQRAGQGGVQRHFISSAHCPAHVLRLARACRPQRSYAMMSRIISAITLFSPQGLVLHQNAGSIAYYGHRSSAMHEGCGVAHTATDGSAPPDNTLRAL